MSCRARGTQLALRQRLSLAEPVETFFTLPLCCRCAGMADTTEG